MLEPTTLTNALYLILTGILFGLGFAIGTWFWGLLLSLTHRKP